MQSVMDALFVPFAVGMAVFGAVVMVLFVIAFNA